MLNMFFSKELCIQTLILNDPLVPDRLVFLNNSEIVLIDYKTGAESLSHVKQLNKYEAVLNEMNLKVVQKILIYSGTIFKIKYCK